MTTRDVVVVGGGIGGLAPRDALAAPGAWVMVVEAEQVRAAHQTGHNGGVIHSGARYKPGWLKARTCVAGCEDLYAFCAEAGVPTGRCGKLMVAPREADLSPLAALAEPGRAKPPLALPHPAPS